MNIKDWSTHTLDNGLCQLLDFQGNVLATFADWQVAEKVVQLAQDQDANNELIEKKDERIAYLEEQAVVNTKDYDDLKEQSENDHRTILDLEKEIDELKIKLWNLSHE